MQPDDGVRTCLQAAPHRAAFATELVADLSRIGTDPETAQRSLTSLAESGDVFITSRRPPDRHLASADLRVVALADPSGTDRSALQRADAVWDDFLRQFLAAHRCG